VLVDQLPHDVGRAADEVDETRAALGAEHGLELVGIELQAGDDLAAVAARAAEARFPGLEHDRLDAALGEMQRGREAGIAPANDTDIGRDRRLEGRCRDRGGSGRGPQRGFERKGLGHGSRSQLRSTPSLPVSAPGS
jgi:hypothetical protein